MSNIVAKNWNIIQSFSEADLFAKKIASTALCPSNYQGKPDDILVAMMMGAELGLAPMQALQNIAVINGKPSIYGDAMVALVRASGQCEYIKEWIDNDVAYCEVKRKGEQNPVTATFSKAQAEKAKLWGKTGPWTSYPERMLQMRARGFALRDVFADILKGFITVEEAQDYPDQEPVKDDPRGSGGISDLDRMESAKEEYRTLVKQLPDERKAVYNTKLSQAKGNLDKVLKILDGMREEVDGNKEFDAEVENVASKLGGKVIEKKIEDEEPAPELELY